MGQPSAVAVSGTAISRHRSQDFDETVAIYRRSMHCDIHADRFGRRRAFEWSSTRAAFGDLSLSISRFGAGYRASSEAPDDLYHLVLPRRGASKATQAGIVTLVVPGRAAFLQSAGAGEVSVEALDEAESFLITIPSAVLKAELEASLGRPITALPRFDSTIDLRTPEIAAYMRYVDFLGGELSHETTMLSAPLVLASLTSTLVRGLLAAQPHDYREQLLRGTAVAPPFFVRRIEEYLVANAAEPIMVRDLANLVGLSVRTIYAGFRMHRGYSPMQFLRRERLDLAHRRLRSRPDLSVTVIATDCGFLHLGHFAAAYRARFGETPSETVRAHHGAGAVSLTDRAPRRG